jgi:hypothetical protein
MLDQLAKLATSYIFVEGEDIGDGCFVTVIVTDDELQFDAHTGASPGSSGQCIGQVILSEFCGFPQHLPALAAHHGGGATPHVVLSHRAQPRADGGGASAAGGSPSRGR